MTEIEWALARRLAAHREWAWRPGMLAVWGDAERWRVVVSYDDERAVGAVQDDRASPSSAGLDGLDCSDPIAWGEIAPDLADPATLGVLLDGVRERWGAASVVYRPAEGRIVAWRVVTWAHGAEWLTPSRLLGEGETEGEALARAWLAAGEVLP